MKLPALVGYLIAGIVIGPATPGFVADLELSSALAEIGVMLLMFGVGLHFSLDDLWQCGGSPCPGALSRSRSRRCSVLQSPRSGAGASRAASSSASRSSVASTVVLLEGAGKPGRSGIGQRPHRRRLAGRRGSGNGVGAGAAAAACGMALGGTPRGCRHRSY